MAQKTEKLKGIIFDKDGTLFDYAQVWEEVLKEGIDSAFTSMGKQTQHRAKKAMLNLMGIDEQGNCLPKGLVFTHRPVRILRRFLTYCLRYRINAFKALKAYERSVHNSEVLLSEKLRNMDFSVQQQLFNRLKEHGYSIGIITNDNASSTALFLSLMGIDGNIDFVCSRDSHYKKKPHTQAFFAFCAQEGLQPQEVAMVGDTVTDMLFAKRARAGYRIALLSGSNDHPSLRKQSSILYPDISYLLHDQRLFDGE
ncbi:MAG: HAD family hydrolase [Sphaerochaeta sp.]|jgi:phosphoglycolate phosphatase|uniref:HAD family hydrolase n=1 Tax=Sphaerochaeta sp. TaxID=1972642 RepID=UPI002FC720E9